MPQIYDMRPTALLPLWRKACWGFFHPEKSWRFRPGLNSRTWVLKGSTLPLDHQSRLPRVFFIHLNVLFISSVHKVLLYSSRIRISLTCVCKIWHLLLMLQNKYAQNMLGIFSITFISSDHLYRSAISFSESHSWLSSNIHVGNVKWQIPLLSHGWIVFSSICSFLWYL